MYKLICVLLLLLLFHSAVHAQPLLYTTEMCLQSLIHAHTETEFISDTSLHIYSLPFVSYSFCHRVLLSLFHLLMLIIDRLHLHSFKINRRYNAPNHVRCCHCPFVIVIFVVIVVVIFGDCVGCAQRFTKCETKTDSKLICFQANGRMRWIDAWRKQINIINRLTF